MVLFDGALESAFVLCFSFPTRWLSSLYHSDVGSSHAKVEDSSTFGLSASKTLLGSQISRIWWCISPTVKSSGAVSRWTPTSIFNKTLVTESYRLSGKPLVTPIHKKGSKHDCINYRTVCLNSDACKIMKRLIRDIAQLYLMQNNLLNDVRNWFIPNRSALTNLLQGRRTSHI